MNIFYHDTGEALAKKERRMATVCEFASELIKSICDSVPSTAMAKVKLFDPNKKELNIVSVENLLLSRVEVVSLFELVLQFKTWTICCVSLID